MKKVGIYVSDPKMGEVIVSESENSKSILSKYSIYLEYQDDLNFFLFRRTENYRPDAGNFTFDIRRKKL